MTQLQAKNNYIKKIVFIVEKSETGYGACSKYENNLITTMGDLTGFGKSWLNENKQDIGFTMIGGCLRFKRKDVEEFIDANYYKVKAKKRYT